MYYQKKFFALRIISFLCSVTAILLGLVLVITKWWHIWALIGAVMGAAGMIWLNIAPILINKLEHKYRDYEETK